MYGLTNKELIELRLKCLEPFVATASKHGIEKDLLIDYAEKAWKYAVKPIAEVQGKTTSSKA